MIIFNIPGKLNNRTLINIIDRLSRIERMIPRDFSSNDASNAAAFAKRMAGDVRFRTSPIERQSDYRDMSLGKSTLDYSGCEVISVYNLLLKYDEGRGARPLPELIERFESDGIVHAGRFGVSPISIFKYLRSIGINADITMDERDFDVLGMFLDHFILTVINDRDNILKQIHTFYISKENDNFIAHNSGLRMRYRSISEIIGALPGGRAKGISLIGVKERGVNEPELT